jgi:hypothetical protein
MIFNVTDPDIKMLFIVKVSKIDLIYFEKDMYLYLEGVSFCKSHTTAVFLKELFLLLFYYDNNSQGL